MSIGRSGLNWLTPSHIESAHLFVDLALGMILFELGYRVPGNTLIDARNRLFAGCALSLAAGGLVSLLLLSWGYAPGASLLAAALCVAGSPAITIATGSELGARGERTGLLYTLVAINGGVALAALVCLAPFLADSPYPDVVSRLGAALTGVVGSVVLGGACAGLVLIGAEKLERQVEHQHLLILGTLVLGVGTAAYLGVSVWLPMLIFGLLVGAIDHDRKVIAVRIAGDVRVLLVIAFVAAGAVIDAGNLRDFWPEVLLIVLARLLGQAVPVLLLRKSLALTLRQGVLLTIGLQPLSSIALVLLLDARGLYGDVDANLPGMLMGTIVLMQLLGPLATQMAIKGFGEAARLPVSTAGGASAEIKGGVS